MTLSMKQYMQTHIQIALALIIIALGVAVGAFVAKERQSDVEKAIRNDLRETQVLMYALAEATDRNGADDDIAALITPCVRRTEYESLLINLGSLTKKDLVLLQNLYEECGYIEPTTKALMVAKLEREFKNYEKLLQLLSMLTTADPIEYKREVWGDIVSREKMRSALLVDLGSIQKEIISALISGATVTSGNVQTFVGNAQDIGQRLIVYDREIDKARAAVKP